MEISETDAEKVAGNLVKDPVSQEIYTNALLTTLTSLEPLRHNDVISLYLLRSPPEGPKDQVQQLFTTQRSIHEETLPGILPTNSEPTALVVPDEKADKSAFSRPPSPIPPPADKQGQIKSLAGGRKGKFKLVVGKTKPEAPKKPALFVPAGFKAAFKGSRRLVQPSYMKLYEPFSNLKI